MAACFCCTHTHAVAYQHGIDGSRKHLRLMEVGNIGNMGGNTLSSHKVPRKPDYSIFLRRGKVAVETRGALFLLCKRSLPPRAAEHGKKEGRKEEGRTVKQNNAPKSHELYGAVANERSSFMPLLAKLNFTGIAITSLSLPSPHPPFPGLPPKRTYMLPLYHQPN